MKKIVLGLLLVIITLSGCSSGNSDSEVKELKKTVDSLKTENSKLKAGQGIQSDHSDSTTESSDQTSNDIKGLNEEVIYKSADTGKELIGVKFIEVTTKPEIFPEYMHSMDDFDTSNLMAAKVEYRNIEWDQPFHFSTHDCIPFDASGKAYKNNSQQEGQDSVGAGRGSTATIFWEVPNAGSVNEIEVDYTPNNLYPAPSTTFKLPVTH